jgi:hypothetical protein
MVFMVNGLILRKNTKYVACLPDILKNIKSRKRNIDYLLEIVHKRLLILWEYF